MISIIDYGMGNLRSVQKAFEKLDQQAEICTEATQISSAQKLVLPGVGAFRDAIRELQRLEMVEPIKVHIAAEKPFLGICLGLQMLFDVSYEEGEWEGLRILPGKVVRFPETSDLKVPHMGWNQLKRNGQPQLLENIPEIAYFYFVHSYYVSSDDPAVVATQTDHGVSFVSMVERGSLFATQFHPEKSQQHGLQLLRNFADLS